jgi:hypothetical protein
MKLAHLHAASRLSIYAGTIETHAPLRSFRMERSSDDSLGSKERPRQARADHRLEHMPLHHRCGSIPMAFQGNTRLQIFALS